MNTACQTRLGCPESHGWVSARRATKRLDESARIPFFRTLRTPTASRMKVTAALGAVIAVLVSGGHRERVARGLGRERPRASSAPASTARRTFRSQAAPALDGAVQVVSTYFSSYALMPDGTVWAWGGNVCGPARRRRPRHPYHAGAGPGPHRRHSDRGGRRACDRAPRGRSRRDMGRRTAGARSATARPRTGAAGTGNQPGLVPVYPNVQGAVAVAAGGADDAVLLSNGTVLAWGENRSGQLGDGTTEEKDVPTPVAGLTGVRAIALGGESSLGGHLLALRSDGTVWAAGEQRRTASSATARPTSSSVAVRVSGLSGVSAISASADHSLALLSGRRGDGVGWGQLRPARRAGRATVCRRAYLCDLVPVRIGVSATAISAGRLYSLVDLARAGARVRLTTSACCSARPGLPAPSPPLVPALSGVSAISAGRIPLAGARRARLRAVTTQMGDLDRPRCPSVEGAQLVARPPSPLVVAPSPFARPGRNRLSDERGRAAGASFLFFTEDVRKLNSVDFLDKRIKAPSPKSGPGADSCSVQEWNRGRPSSSPRLGLRRTPREGSVRVVGIL